jgi:hypothetical protein
MPAGQRPPAATAWTIRSVAVRTRDGPERLDQAYRRLMGDTSRDEPPPAPDRLPERTGAVRAPEPRR